MNFTQGKQEYTLKGLVCLPTKTNAKNKKNKNQKIREDGILLELSSIVSQDKEEYKRIHEEERLQKLLNQYSDIFYAPLPLPLLEHRIIYYHCYLTQFQWSSTGILQI